MEKTNKTQYLTYIEETPKHHDLLKKIVKRSGESARKKSKSYNVSITYLEGQKIIKQDSEGNKIILKNIEQTPKTVKVGTKIELQKR